MADRKLLGGTRCGGYGGGRAGPGGDRDGGAGDWREWMGKVGVAGLKLKLYGAIVAISGIRSAFAGPAVGAGEGPSA